MHLGPPDLVSQQTEFFLKSKMAVVTILKNLQIVIFEKPFRQFLMKFGVMMQVDLPNYIYANKI